MIQAIATAMPLPLLGLVGWSVVPDFATKHLLSLFHRFAILPAPADPPTYRKQYALTFAFVVLTYLSYNLIDSARSMPPNFYQILSVDPTVDEQGLKAAFRQFAKRNHPDRPGVGREGEQLFIMVRDVYEALKNPVVRFAYDRFGPDVLTWSQRCTTTREYIQHGLTQSSGYHIVVGAALIFWSLIGSSGANPASFWRYTLYATLFAAEISLILSPSPSPAPPSTPTLAGLLTTYTTHTPLHTLFPQRLIHQHILFLHQLFVFLSIALSRVVPVIISAFSNDAPTPPPAVTQEIIHNIAQLAAIADRETSVMVHTLLHSVASPASTATSPPSETAPPHEDISSFARPRHFEVPRGVFDFPDPRTPPTDAEPSFTAPATAADEKHAAHPLAKLTREIEELIIEANIKKDDGPLRSVWEAAVLRGRRLAAAVAPVEAGENREAEVVSPRRNFWEAPEDREGRERDTAGADEARSLRKVNFVDEREITIPGLERPASPRRADRAGRMNH